MEPFESVFASPLALAEPWVVFLTPVVLVLGAVLMVRRVVRGEDDERRALRNRKYRLQLKSAVSQLERELRRWRGERGEG